MKKLIGILAVASVLSFVMMGCAPPAEGDTAAPAGKPEASGSDNASVGTPKPDAGATTGGTTG